jgi:hypothetical protein
MVTLILLMQTMRTRLSLLVAMWLSLQAVASMAAPVVLYAAAAQSVDAACTCPDAKPGDACPMHGHHSKHRSDDGAPQCVARSAFSESHLAWFAVTLAGPLPSRAFVPSTLLPGKRVFPTLSIRSGRTELPDSPPPRV